MKQSVSETIVENLLIDSEYNFIVSAAVPIGVRGTCISSGKRQAVKFSAIGNLIDDV